jgi:hypothetical protein
MTISVRYIAGHIVDGHAVETVGEPQPNALNLRNYADGDWCDYHLASHRRSEHEQYRHNENNHGIFQAWRY